MCWSLVVALKWHTIGAMFGCGMEESFWRQATSWSGRERLSCSKDELKLDGRPEVDVVVAGGARE